MYSEVVKLMDAGFIVDIAMFNFSKAFNVVSHILLIKKLRDIGISPLLLNWIWSFLSDREMCVSVGGVCSGFKDVLSEVPQGSVLGPVLFLVYVNYLTQGLVSQFGAFADDYKIYLQYDMGSDAGVEGRLTLQRDWIEFFLWLTHGV